MKKIFPIIILAIMLIFQPLHSQEVDTTATDTVRLYVVTKSTTRFYKDMGNMSTVISIIPKGEKVQILEEVDDYYRVFHSDADGYIKKNKVEFDAESKAYLESFWAEEDAREQAIQEPSLSDDNRRLDKQDYLIKKYGTKIGMKVFEHAIWRGMTRDMVWDSWGRPKKINRRYEWLELKEEWVYPTAWLFFDDGRLTGWRSLR